MFKAGFIFTLISLVVLGYADAATTLSPASGTESVYGTDLEVTATIDTTESYTITVKYGTTPDTLGTITVNHTQTDAANKVFVDASSINAPQYALAEVTDATVKVTITAIAASDNGLVLTFDSNDANNTYDASYTVNAVENLSSPIVTLTSSSGTKTGVGNDLEVTATIDTTQSYTITVKYGTSPDTLGTITVDHTQTEAANKVVVDDSGIDAAQYALAEVTDATVKVTITAIAVSDNGLVLVFDSTIATHDASYVVTVGCPVHENMLSVASSTGTSCTSTDYNVGGCVTVFECASGYYGLAGDTAFTCSDTDYTWNGTLPTCTKGCPVHDASVQAKTSTGSGCTTTEYYRQGCETVFSCASGYSGSADVTSNCSSDATWSESLPTTCKQDCDISVLNTTTTEFFDSITSCTASNFFNDGCIVTFKCKQGYTGDNFARNCTSGTWNNTDFDTCMSGSLGLSGSLFATLLITAFLQKFI